MNSRRNWPVLRGSVLMPGTSMALPQVTLFGLDAVYKARHEQISH